MAHPPPPGAADRHAPAAAPARDDNDTWKLLQVLFLYRLALAGTLIVLSYGDIGPALFVGHARRLYVWSSLGYLLFVLLGGLALYWRAPSTRTQAYVQVVGEIVAITLIMHASGGIGSGLGMLMVVTVAGGGLVIQGRLALVLAAFATLMVLVEQMYAVMTQAFDGTAYTQAGLLGALFFATAALANALAERVRATEALARQRSRDIAKLEKLNRYIVRHMRSGILVVDQQHRVEMVNESVGALLNAPEAGRGDNLRDLSPELAEQLQEWLDNPRDEPRMFRPARAPSDVLPRFARLSMDQTPRVLVFLEDSSVVTQQAQQVKMASLGRLAGSIAHEIRNPLGAISHAGQLLGESPSLDLPDKRLTEIIRTQSQRVNDIIENVQQISRRDPPRPREFDLGEWLDVVVAEFAAHAGVGPQVVSIAEQASRIQALVDPSQLQQVVVNLCQNALRYGRAKDGSRQVEVRYGLGAETRTPYLEVVDHGPGIDPQHSRQIFEPFFTTQSSGTGLGLYIARELCEYNQARLDYLPVPGGGCCFRISLPDPHRKVL